MDHAEFRKALLALKTFSVMGHFEVSARELQEQGLQWLAPWALDEVKRPRFRFVGNCRLYRISDLIQLVSAKVTQ
jgi:hypothetical protein